MGPYEKNKSGPWDLQLKKRNIKSTHTKNTQSGERKKNMVSPNEFVKN